MSQRDVEEQEHDPEHDEDWEERVQPKWINLVDGPFTKADELCVDLRRLQQRCKCSDATCDEILRTLSKYLSLGDTTNFRKCDKKMHDMAGTTVLRLNGCPKCNKHVYLPTDKESSCPHVNEDGQVCGHSRYDADGKPLEVRGNIIMHAARPPHSHNDTCFDCPVFVYLFVCGLFYFYLLTAAGILLPSAN